MSERTQPQRRAFSVLEVMVAISILAVVILSVLGGLQRNHELRETTREGEVALRLIELELERLRGTPVGQVVGQLEAADPQGEAHAAVSVAPELLSRATLRTQVLSEVGAAAALGLPPGLELDADPAGSDIASYSVVPVRISLNWTSLGGRERVEQVVTLLYPTTTLRPR